MDNFWICLFKSCIGLLYQSSVHKVSYCSLVNTTTQANTVTIAQANTITWDNTTTQHIFLFLEEQHQLREMQIPWSLIKYVWAILHFCHVQLLTWVKKLTLMIIDRCHAKARSETLSVPH